MNERALRWQKFGMIAAIVTLACTVIVTVLTSIVGATYKEQLDHDREVSAAQHAMQIDADYAVCQKGNDTRSALRDGITSHMELVFHVAPPQTIDPAILNDPQLRQLAEIKQASDKKFREDQQVEANDQLAQLQPRDCDAERHAADG